MPKKIHRFLLTETSQTTITEKRVVHQMRSVLKLKPGDLCSIFYHHGPEYRILLETISPLKITYSIVERVLEPVRLPSLIAAVALIKHANFELVVQKLSELGVAEILPLLTERTVKQSLRRDRLQKISDEAVELSGGISQVKLHEPLSLSAAITVYANSPWIVCSENGTASCQAKENSIIAIGPEGGWSEKDLLDLQKVSPRYLSLGSRTLRAETAALLGAFTVLYSVC